MAPSTAPLKWDQSVITTSASFEYIVKYAHVDIEETLFSDGGRGEQFRSVEESTFNPEVFNTDELETLALVTKKFKKIGTREIV